MKKAAISTDRFMVKRSLHIFFYIIAICICSNVQVHAQKTSANATINPSQIQIGEQAVITLEIKAPKGRHLELPQYNYTDTIINGLEVILQAKPDTTIDHEVMSISQKYLVTSFDSALYNIPHLVVIDLDTKDTILTRNLGLKVVSPVLSDSTLAYLKLLETQQTDSIDFNALQIADIKPIQEPPFVWQDLLEYLWLAVLILVILIILVVGIFLITRKKKKGYFFTPIIKLPPHVSAINNLDKIKNEKIWHQGREKEYYTQITDTLREYIEERYGINAFEQTSDEILDSLRFEMESESAKENLQQILKLADLVKFAKYKPLIDENDLSLMNAYLFINQTKVEVSTNPEDDKKDGVKGKQVGNQKVTNS